MTIYLKKDTAAQEVPIGQFLSTADGDTEQTGLTIASTDIYLWKNGSTALANVTSSNNAIHMAKGIYYAVFDATDTNTAGPLIVYSHPSGALTARQECMVLPALVYDSLVAGSDALQVDTIQVSGTTQAARDLGTSVLVGDKTGFALTTAQHDLIGARAWTESTRALTDKATFTLSSDYDAAKTAANSTDVLELPTLAEIEASTVLAKEATVGEVNNLIGNYSISSPVYSTSGKMLTATITAGTTTRSVVATYSSDDNMATYAVSS